MKVLIKVLKSVLALIVIGYGAYIALNAPTLYKLITNRSNQASAQSNAQTQAIKDATQTAPKRGTPDKTAMLKAELAARFKNDWLYYPRLDIKAPVTWEVPQSQVAKVMPDSLIHLDGTAQPEQNGDVLISGHSSYYYWNQGAYKNIFAPLVNTKENDDIVIRKNDVVYFYRVLKIYEIGAKEGLKVNIGGTNPKKLELMTCVPVGTSLRRLIVEAKLVKSI